MLFMTGLSNSRLTCLMSVEDRRRAFEAGHRAEKRAALFLRFKGFRILTRRYKCSVGEIDLIARRGSLMIYVEVKARQTETIARNSITPRQRKRIARAAEHFLMSHPAFLELEQRFDAILLVPRQLPIHIQDAWR